MTRSLLIAMLFFLPMHLSAQSLDSMRAAKDLGALLAAEEFCGLSYSQDAINHWIDENVDPADMSFTNKLNMMTGGAAFNLKGISESSKTAHCRSIERTAQHFGFVN